MQSSIRESGSVSLAPAASRTLSPRAWSLARRNPLGVVCAAFLLVLAVLAVAAPSIAPYKYDQPNVVARLHGPSRAHLFGTDGLGRDVFSRILYGARVSLGLSFGSVALATAVALAVGLITGYIGGWLDSLVQRLVDMLMSFPGLLLVISLTAFFGIGIITLLFGIAIALLGGAIRVTRAATVQVSSFAYIEAAVASGAGTPRLLLQHVLPNVLAPVIVLATAQLGIAILIEASVSFLGFGIQPPFPSWGGMLGGEARSYLTKQPLLSLWPGFAIFLAAYSFNIVGDALRDELDPRLRRRA
jgi:peptide/nickel transport system permease protein